MKRITRQKAKPRAATPCTYKLQDIKTPYGGEYLGTRLVAAIKNSAGKAFGDVCTSYRTPYFIADFAILSEADKARAVASLRGMGYDPSEEG